MVSEVDKAVQALKEGKVILYPTDTIWGLGCDPTNDEAVSKIFSIKKRNDGKALIVLIEEIGQLYNYVDNIPEIAWDIVEFAEKPLTVIYPTGRNVSSKLLADDGSIAIRLTKDDFCKKVIRKFGKGIVSTSANISGEKSPSSFTKISKEVLESVEHIVSHRQNENMQVPPSTIMKIELDGEVKFIRK